MGPAQPSDRSLLAHADARRELKLVNPMGHEGTGEAHHQDARSCDGDKVN
jgi:hypothetical protein